MCTLDFRKKRKINKTRLRIMKTNKFLTIILAFVACIAITSCVQDDDYTVPNSLGDEENEALTELLAQLADVNSGVTELTISQVKELYTAYEDAQSGFDYDKFYQITSNVVVKGYVSSSDATGNFYKEFFIQDSPSNPTAAIQVVLNQADSYNQFNQGREVYIKLQDIYVGLTSSEVIAIGGKTDDDEVGQFTATQIPDYILRSTNTEVITALDVNLSSINESHVGMFVKIDNAEFPAYLNGELYGDSSEDFDTQRALQACDGFSYSNFIVETSSFANFYNSPLPVDKGGSISGIVTKSYGGDDLVLALNSLEDVVFDQERCVLWNEDDFSVVFEEDFESMPTYTTIASNGWLAYAQEGGYNWRAVTSSDSGNNTTIASMSAYNSGDASNITWLITPGIDLDATSDEFLNFESSNSFSDGSELEVLISTDWDGTEAGVLTATWSTLDAQIVEDSEFYQNWVSSGIVDLSTYAGSINVAFKYTGGDVDDFTGTFEIDNVKVLGQ